MAFTPPGTAGLSADGFSPSGGGEEGDLISSGIARNAQTSGSEAYGENVNFYQLDDNAVNELGQEVLAQFACVCFPGFLRALRGRSPQPPRFRTLCSSLQARENGDSCGVALALSTLLSLITLDQVADTLRIALAMAIAGDGIGATRGLNPNFGPQHSRGDMHGGNF